MRLDDFSLRLNMFAPISLFFCKISLLAILVDGKSNDALMNFFLFFIQETVYVPEMSISLYF
jgi:hypothetical protein